eukprot:g18174.t1
MQCCRKFSKVSRYSWDYSQGTPREVSLVYNRQGSLVYEESIPFPTEMVTSCKLRSATQLALARLPLVTAASSSLTNLSDDSIELPVVAALVPVPFLKDFLFESA